MSVLYCERPTEANALSSGVVVLAPASEAEGIERVRMILPNSCLIVPLRIGEEFRPLDGSSSIVIYIPRRVPLSTRRVGDLC